MLASILQCPTGVTDFALNTCTDGYQIVVPLVSGLSWAPAVLGVFGIATLVVWLRRLLLP